MSTTHWIAVTVGLVGVAVLVGRLRANRQEFGFVSDQWIAQHRAGPTLDAF